MFKKISLVIMILTSTTVVAQQTHSNGNTLTETGQSAFAAIAEIVEQLRKDDETDWSMVKIDALRDHLVDMNNVTIRSNVVTSQKDGQIIFSVTGNSLIAGSIQRMMNAHAHMLANETGWSVAIKNQPGGAIMTIAPAENEIALVTALGFHGIMTIGAHHQAHHKVIAMGGNPH